MLASTTIQAFGKAKASLLLSIARQGLFYIPLLFLLNNRFFFKGLLWAQPVSDAITLSLALVLLVFILKKYQNKEDVKISDLANKSALHRGVITISREYGSGGREIGEKLAAELNIPYYDKKLIDLTAAKSGLDSELIGGIEESVTEEISHNALTCAYYRGNIFAYDGTPESDSIFSAQSSVISSLADAGDCVIVGRCANAVLKSRCDSFNVFIHAPIESRIKRVTEQYGVKTDDAESLINCVDKVRADYYKHYTGDTWGNNSNYHLSLDSSELGVDGCVNVILEALKVRKTPA